ncbi:peptidase MA family metallohydrolase [Chloroflexota bacterium]
MLKKNYYINFLLTLVLCLSLLSPFSVASASELEVGKERVSGVSWTQSVEVDFPLALHFNLSAESVFDITDVRLHYTVDQESHAEVTSEVYVEFAPGTTIDVQWTWDMRKTGGLPPGAGLECWWTVEDINGDKIETAPLKVHFDDNRYSWRSLTEDNVTIYWYEGDSAFGGEIMRAAQQALARLEGKTGAYLKEPVKIFVYADSRDLQDAMVFPQEWTGGVAFTRYGVIAIGISPKNLSWGRGAIAHELTHLVIHQMIFNPYSGLPTWLDEGLAMSSEESISPVFGTSLVKAIAADNLISVRSLSSPFSAYAEESYLSYAQSYSLVDFLITGYGQSKMLELLNTFSEGSSYDAALEKVYGFDMDVLDILWREYVAGLYQ